LSPFRTPSSQQQSIYAVNRNGVGVDNLPIAKLNERGIAVLTAASANAAAVTELALALILAALRQIPAADAGIKAGGRPRHRGREMRNCHLGVIGCGAIGRDVARLAGVLDAQVIGHDPMRPEFDRPPGFRWAEIPDLLAGGQISSRCIARRSRRISRSLMTRYWPSCGQVQSW
jgi:D-3-phosphoglycerate dehydrogenase